jgi:hypothetical protein
MTVRRSRHPQQQSRRNANVGRKSRSASLMSIRHEKEISDASRRCATVGLPGEIESEREVRTKRGVGRKQ